MRRSTCLLFFVYYVSCIKKPCSKWNESIITMAKKIQKSFERRIHWYSTNDLFIHSSLWRFDSLSAFSCDAYRSHCGDVTYLTLADLQLGEICTNHLHCASNNSCCLHPHTCSAKKNLFEQKYRTKLCARGHPRTLDRQTARCSHKSNGIESTYDKCWLSIIVLLSPPDACLCSCPIDRSDTFHPDSDPHSRQDFFLFSFYLENYKRGIEGQW